MSDEPINLYKQMILHILHRASMSLPQSVVLEIMVGSGYTDYIRAQSSLGELIESGLVIEYTTYRQTYLSLSEIGDATRMMFEDELSSDIRKELDTYLKNNHIETMDEIALISDYQSTKDGMYIATCAIRDGNKTVYGITLEVADEASAIHICDSWKKHAEKLYTDTLQQLLGGDPDPDDDSH